MRNTRPRVHEGCRHSSGGCVCVCVCVCEGRHWPIKGQGRAVPKGTLQGQGCQGLRAPQRDSGRGQGGSGVQHGRPVHVQAGQTRRERPTVAAAPRPVWLGQGRRARVALRMAHAERRGALL